MRKIKFIIYYFLVKSKPHERIDLLITTSVNIYKTKKSNSNENWWNNLETPFFIREPPISTNNWSIFSWPPFLSNFKNNKLPPNFRGGRGTMRVLQILRERFSLSHVFYLTVLPAGFKASLGADSSTYKLARLHTDLSNIAPSSLFVWITTIYKGFVLEGLFKGHGWSANKESVSYRIWTFLQQADISAASYFICLAKEPYSIRQFKVVIFAF